MSQNAENPTAPPLPSSHAVELHPTATEVGPGYEVRDTNIRAIVLFLVGLAVFLVLAQVGLWGLLKDLRKEEPGAFTPAAGAPATIVEQLRALREYERDVLDGKVPAGTVSEAGTAPKAGRVSIDRAIELLSERGIPPLPGPPKTEAEVNSHSGTPASTPDTDGKTPDRAKPEGDKRP